VEILETWLYLLVIIAIAIIFFWMSGLPKIKNNKLSFLMGWLGLNVLATPLSIFIGGMATDAPSSTMFNFWMGFLFVHSIPLFILMIGILKWLFDIIKDQSTYK
jgi:hypothetical protein